MRGKEKFFGLTKPNLHGKTAYLRHTFRGLDNLQKLLIQVEMGYRFARGLCVSGNYVYITDGKEGCCHVSVFRISGEFVNSFGCGRGELCQPHSIAVDKHGFVFVCDSSNNCI